MEINVSDRLGALSHPKRLDVFRLLMRRYPDRVPAGEIAEALNLRPNTASGYLNALRAVGLIEQHRIATSLQYEIHLANVRSMFAGLLGDCCQNRPDICIQMPPALAPDTIGASGKDRVFNALFVCTGNSARSIMAESILNLDGGGKFRAYSAGTQPQGTPRPEVIDLLGGKGYDVSDLRSKSVDDFVGPDAPKMDFVFTVCDHAANEACPTWPGQPLSAHWGLADPVRATGTLAQQQLAYQQAYGVLRNRIAAFVHLPVDTLDRISLQHKLDDIGRETVAAD